jgi:PIN domain nuclease of toxin-antitoxin system
MKLLLDTHVFIWWDSSPSRLSSKAVALCQDRANEILLSVASVWEMQIKIQLGKLNLTVPLNELIERQQERNGVTILDVTLQHVLALRDLPPYHRDPFDRLLIAQANVENITLVSNDSLIAKYPVQRIF